MKVVQRIALKIIFLFAILALFRCTKGIEIELRGQGKGRFEYMLQVHESQSMTSDKTPIKFRLKADREVVFKDPITVSGSELGVVWAVKPEENQLGSYIIEATSMSKSGDIVLAFEKHSIKDKNGKSGYLSPRSSTPSVSYNHSSEDSSNLNPFRVKATKISASIGFDNYGDPIELGDRLYFTGMNGTSTNGWLYSSSKALTSAATLVDQNGDLSKRQYGHDARNEYLRRYGNNIISKIFNSESTPMVRFSRVDGSTGVASIVCQTGATSTFDMGIADYTYFDNKLYFTGKLPSTAFSDLHVCDLTTGAAERVIDLRAGADDSPQYYSPASNLLYFVANNSFGRRKLYKMDQSQSVTQVSDTRASQSADDNPIPLATQGDAVLFASEVSVGVSKLFIYTGSGSVNALPNIEPLGVSEDIHWSIGHAGGFYFAAAGSDRIPRLYRGEITGGSAFSHSLVHASNEYTQPTLPEKIGTGLFIKAINSAGYWRLLRIDASGLVQEVNPFNLTSNRHTLRFLTKFQKVGDQHFYSCLNEAGYTRLCSISTNGLVNAEDVDYRLYTNKDADPVVIGKVAGHLLVAALNPSGQRQMAVIVNGAFHFQDLGREVDVSPASGFYTDGTVTLVPLRTEDPAKLHLQYFVISKGD